MPDDPVSATRKELARRHPRSICADRGRASCTIQPNLQLRAEPRCPDLVSWIV